MKTIEGYTYKVNEHIGKGYSSTVHKGLNDKTGQEVSIKVIEMAKLEDPINQMLLQLEVTALKSLTQSKHVLHLYDVYATRNNTYLITQLCEGDLNSLLKQRKTIPYFEAVEIMRQLITGYFDIHKAGYLHRDIKPANIFYKNGVYKYGDFGFAIPVNDIHNHKNYNVGSPVYMPPQALKENVYSVSCDIWALGIIFYQLLKGSVPWRAISQQVLYDKIVSEPIDSLSHGLPEVAKKFLSEVLSLDCKLRPTPDKLLAWPNQLQSAPIQIRNISPLDQRVRPPLALKQVNSNSNNVNIKPTNFYFSHNKLSPRRENHSGLCNSKDQSAMQQLLRGQVQHRGQESEYKQCYLFVNNYINYIKFLHRVIKFMSPPLSSQPTVDILAHSIMQEIFTELQNLKMMMSESEESEVKIEGWREFLKSTKYTAISKKLRKYENKYHMFYEHHHASTPLEDTQIMQCINTFMAHLELPDNYKPKLVVAADYLTTLYQLLHLRKKYQIHEFMKLSKIDLIMQGNPYNTNRQHLQKLRKKLLLIRP